MKIFLLSLSILLTSLSVYAVDECASYGCISTITTLYTNVNGDIYIGTPLDEKLANCTPVSNKYFTLNPNSGNAKEVYSSFLSAYISGEKIQLRIKEGHAKCELAYVRFDKSF